MEESITAIIVHARGEVAIRAAHEAFGKALDSLGDKSAAPATDKAATSEIADVKAAVPQIRYRAVAQAVANVRKAAKKPGLVGVDGLVCPECGRACANARALGFHRSKMHGVPGKYTRPKGAGKYPCGHNGCFETFATVGWRESHWEKKHGKATG